MNSKLSLFMLLFLVNNINGMEIISRFLFSNEPKHVKLLKHKEKTLKKNLYFTSWSPVLRGRDSLGCTKYNIPASEQFNKSDIPNNPVRFLQYIYYKEYYDNQWDSKDFSLYTLEKDSNNTLLKVCKDARNEGYSALGVALLTAPHESWYREDYILMRKEDLIRDLLKLGFEPTPEDQELAYLELHSRTSSLTDKIILLLAGKLKNPESNLAKLPLELLLQIIPYEEPLIPRDLCKDCPKIRKLR